MTEQTTQERFTRLAVILGTAQYNESGIAKISQEMVGEIQLTVKDAQAEIAALTAQLAEARATIARRESDLAAARITITELESERNGANAWLDEVAYILQTPPAYMGGVNGWAQVKMQELAEAREQIAALTPRAELKGKARYNPIDQSTLKISVDAKSLKLTPETRQRISKFVEGVHRNAGVR